MSLRYRVTTLVLSLAGVLFSGYLSGVRFLTNECALNEPCPLFLGYPACYFGFSMFVALFVVSTTALLTKKRWTLYANLTISTLGMLFAGYFAIADIRVWFTQGFATYALGLSSCIYGAIFFIIIWIVSLTAAISSRRRSS